METGTPATLDRYKETRYVHYCKDCQSTQFEDYVDYTGVDMAFYLCCAAYNLPFIPEAVPSRRNADGETWKTYLENLKILDRDVTDNGEPAAFSDGMTDLSMIFDGKVPCSPAFAGGLTADGVAAYKKFHRIKDDADNTLIAIPYEKCREMCIQISNLERKMRGMNWLEARISKAIQRDMWSSFKYGLRLAQILERRNLAESTRTLSDWTPAIQVAEQRQMKAPVQAQMRPRMLGRTGRLR